MSLKWMLPFAFCLSLFACKEKQKSASDKEKPAAIVPLKVEDTTQTYFSVDAYLQEQWDYKKDDPITMLKIEVINGKRDSAFVPLDSNVWRTMMQPFYESDISNKKFLGWYRFDSFNEAAMQSNHLHYEAISPDYVTQKLDVSADEYSNKIKAIYVETRQEKGITHISRKMQYRSGDIVQIVESEKEEGKPSIEKVIEYKFKY